ncbi:hypothetical protein LCGC14_0808170 [marine sediment metagenome]|uniref:LamG-like jellyroll fold domain-containing protein n=1 Tax=marine sediment metagenome TaxID=412755 RepID=A0A0F9S7L1_9ZZZZ
MGWTFQHKPLLGTPLDGSEPLSQGLVGLWLMNKGSGNKVFDLSGNREILTFGAGAASPIWVPGEHDSAISFDGGDNITGAALKSPLSLPVTIVAYAKFDSTGGWDPIFSSHDVNGQYHGVLLHNRTSTDMVWLQYGDGDGVTSNDRRTKEGTTALVADRWYHLAGVIRGAGDMDIYVDGVEDGGSYSGTGDVMSISSGVPTIGQWFAPTDNWLSGDVGYIYLYNNRALTASEIALLYRNPFIMFERDPIELWVGSVGAVVAGNAGIMTTNTGFWGPTF